MTKLTSAAWLAAATIVFSGCADTSETAGSSPSPSASAASPAAVQPPGDAAAATAVGGIDQATRAGATDTSTSSNIPTQPNGTQPAVGSQPTSSGTQSGGGANPKPAIVKARVVPGAGPVARAGAAGGNPTLGGGSSGVDGVAAVRSEAAISAKTGVAEFTTILIDRIRRKINQKRGRSSPPSGAGLRGVPDSSGVLRRTSSRRTAMRRGS